MKAPDLWKRFKEGDEKALEEIYFDNYNLLYNYLNKLGGNTALTEDCIQDIFLKLWKSRKTLGAVQSVKSYLLAIARREIIRKIRKKRQHELSVAGSFKEEINIKFSAEEIIIDSEASEEKRRRVSAALNSLPDRQREAIYLKYYEGLSYDEVAYSMGVNYQSVVNLIYKAFKALRKSDLLRMLYAIPVLFSLACRY